MDFVRLCGWFQWNFMAASNFTASKIYTKNKKRLWWSLNKKLMQRRYRRCGLSSLQMRNQTNVFTSTVAHIQLHWFFLFFSLVFFFPSFFFFLIRPMLSPAQKHTSNNSDFLGTIFLKAVSSVDNEWFIDWLINWLCEWAQNKIKISSSKSPRWCLIRNIHSRAGIWYLPAIRYFLLPDQTWFRIIG